MSGYYDKEGKRITRYEREQLILADTSREYRRVAVTFGDDWTVSTVWWGIDLPQEDGNPMIFETHIFGGPHRGEAERYATLEDAQTGHERWVNKHAAT